MRQKRKHYDAAFKRQAVELNNGSKTFQNYLER